MNLPTNQVAAKLADMIPSLRIFALQEERVRTQLQAALTALTTQPVAFLQHNIVVCQPWGCRRAASATMSSSSTIGTRPS
ncbi:MAG: hypothetical protein ACP5NI_10965 [Acetobacteraceae bacterium]